MKLIFSFLLLVFAPAFSLISAQTCPYFCGKSHEHLHSGTTVTFELMEAVDSGDLTQGQPVSFKVEMEVRTNDKVLIRSNVSAVGRVKEIKNKGSYNHPEELILEVTKVLTVDGQLIPINGQERIFKAKHPGESVVAGSGAKFVGYVVNDVFIKL